MSIFKRTSVSSVGATPKDVANLAEMAKQRGAGKAHVKAWHEEVENTAGDGQVAQVEHTGVNRDIYNRSGIIVYTDGHTREARTTNVSGGKIVTEIVTDEKGRQVEVKSGKGKLPEGGSWSLMSMPQRVRGEREDY